MNSALLSSKSVEYETPQDFFDALNTEFALWCDVCATSENTKCPFYFTPEKDGLSQQWSGRCWMNPPYGRKIGKWIKKAYESSLTGALMVCLVPSRTDTRWWHEYCVKGEVRFVKGRLKFGGCKDPAPFPCAVVIFRPPNGCD